MCHFWFWSRQKEKKLVHKKCHRKIFNKIGIQKWIDCNASRLWSLIVRKISTFSVQKWMRNKWIIFFVAVQYENYLLGTRIKMEIGMKKPNLCRAWNDSYKYLPIYANITFGSECLIDVLWLLKSTNENDNVYYRLFVFAHTTTPSNRNSLLWNTYTLFFFGVFELSNELWYFWRDDP